jgi:hypothetical protein
MSLILDALSRAERDRRREEGPAPDLLADHGSPARSSALRRSRLLFMGTVILVLAGVSVWLSSRGGQGEGGAGGNAVQSEQVNASPSRAPLARPGGAGTAASGTLSPQTGAARPAAPSRASATPQPVTAPPGQSISAAEIARLYEQRDDSAARQNSVTAADPGAPAADAAPSMPRTTEEAPAVPEPETGERAAAPDEQPVDLEQVLRQARAELAASRLTDHPAPLLQTLTKQFRDRVPTLMYLRHDYNPAGSSTVLINGETLRVGGRTRGVEVREILADSVILRFEDRDFRLRALNSWVNL